MNNKLIPFDGRTNFTIQRIKTTHDVAHIIILKNNNFYKKNIGLNMINITFININMSEWFQKKKINNTTRL